MFRRALLIACLALVSSTSAAEDPATGSTAPTTPLRVPLTATASSSADAAPTPARPVPSTAAPVPAAPAPATATGEPAAADTGRPVPDATPARTAIQPQWAPSVPVPEMPAVAPAQSPAMLAEPGQKRYQVPGEWVLYSRTPADATRESALLQPFGLKVRARKNLAALDMVITLLVQRGEEDPLRLLQQVRQQQPQLRLEWNRYFFPLGEPDSGTGQEQRAPPWPQVSIGFTGECRDHPVVLGLMDTGVPPGLSLTPATELVTHSVSGDDYSASHAGAIAYIWSGEEGGLFSHARILSVNIFADGPGGEPATTTLNILMGLNWLLEQAPKPQAINLSFGGVDSFIVNLAMQRVARDVPLAAAAGNGGPRARPLFPAALEAVVAVTAVDARGRLFERANQGDYIDLAAPGVDVPTVNSAGERWFASGTSFAAPYVTAALALNGGDVGGLSQMAADLGPTGRDKLFGSGMLALTGVCGGGKEPQL